MHYAIQVQHELNINSLLAIGIQFFPLEGEGSLNLQVHEERGLLRDSSNFWHEIATEDWLGRRTPWLGVPSMLGYMVFVSTLAQYLGEILPRDVHVDRERRTSRTMLDGIIHHLSHRLIRMFVYGDVQLMSNHSLQNFRDLPILQK